MKALNLLTFNSIFKQICGKIQISYGREEFIFHYLLGFMLLGGIFLQILNYTTFHFTVFPLPVEMFTGLPFILMTWWVVGHLNRQQWPRLGLLLTTASNLWVFIIIGSLGTASIITTPFSIIDHHLVRADQWFGFNVAETYAMGISIS